jgi:hypothetical protein
MTEHGFPTWKSVPHFQVAVSHISRGKVDVCAKVLIATNESTLWQLQARFNYQKTLKDQELDSLTSELLLVTIISVF